MRPLQLGPRSVPRKAPIAPARADRVDAVCRTASGFEDSLNRARRSSLRSSARQDGKLVLRRAATDPAHRLARASTNGSESPTRVCVFRWSARTSRTCAPSSVTGRSRPQQLADCPRTALGRTGAEQREPEHNRLVHRRIGVRAGSRPHRVSDRVPEVQNLNDPGVASRRRRDGEYSWCAARHRLLVEGRPPADTRAQQPPPEISAVLETSTKPAARPAAGRLVERVWDRQATPGRLG